MIHPLYSHCWQHSHLSRSIRRLLQHFADDTTSLWGSGTLSPSAYETAWVALVRDPHDPHRVAFPEALAWLIDHQDIDGHWGASFPYNILPTMAALLALLRAPQTPKIRTTAQRATVYLHQMVPLWSLANCDTPYIEFLMPRLYEDLVQAGCELIIPEMPMMQARRSAKLALVPFTALYTGMSPLIHALEAFGPAIDFRRLKSQQAPDGGYGYSPSATAAVLLYAPEWDEPAARWLTHLMKQPRCGQSGAVPTSAPSDIFEIAWSLFLLLDGAVDLARLAPHAMATLATYLAVNLSPTGARFGRWSTLPPDVDDTAMVIATLQRLGQSLSRDALQHFKAPDHYATFAHERTSSPSANAHVLEALFNQPDLIEEQVMVIQYLEAQQGANGAWQDKWNVSEVYATMCCALALARVHDPHLNPVLQRSLQWVIETQHSTGTWGHAAPSLEETAYSVITLKQLMPLALSRQQSALQRALRRGQSYIWRHIAELKSGPALWIDKDVYRPTRVVQAAVYAALYL